MSASRFQALIQTYIEPVLVQAGFAKGQWAEERRLLGLRDPERDVEDLAEVLADLYSVSS